MSADLGPRPERVPRNLVRPRQLTIGECIAIARYGEQYIGESGQTVAMNRLLDLIDDLEVCTTCGWGVHVHDCGAEHKRLINCCPQHTRQL